MIRSMLVGFFLFLTTIGCAFSAELHAEEKIPEALAAMKTFSQEQRIPLTYLRHDLLALADELADENKKTLLLQLNMEREEYIEQQYHRSIEFEVEGNTAYMIGKIDRHIFSEVIQLMQRHPEVDTIELVYIIGSVDDFKNFQAIQYLRDFQLTTKIGKKGFIASGGVDFLLAGTTRIIERGAKIGVHSRRYQSVYDANTLSRLDTRHAPWLSFYSAMGIPTDYYRFVLDNATADQVYRLTEDDLVRFEFTDALIEPIE